MKNILFYVLFILIMSSCTTLMGVDYWKRTKELDLGMTKQEVIVIMGKDYMIESLSETDEGKMEVLHFYNGGGGPTYILYLLNNNLVEFHKYISPCPPQEVRVVKE